MKEGKGVEVLVLWAEFSKVEARRSGARRVGLTGSRRGSVFAELVLSERVLVSTCEDDHDWQRRRPDGGVEKENAPGEGGYGAPKG